MNGTLKNKIRDYKMKKSILYTALAIAFMIAPMTSDSALGGVVARVDCHSGCERMKGFCEWECQDAHPVLGQRYVDCLFEKQCEQNQAICKDRCDDQQQGQQEQMDSPHTASHVP